MKKKILSVLLVSALAAAFTACGSSSNNESAAADSAAAESAASTAEESGDLTVIKVAASETPHSQILEQAKPLLAEQGYDLQVTVFSDYVQPNNVVEDGRFRRKLFPAYPVP